MADQQRIQPPYGDIFFVNTPTIDRWGQQMYAEQKQREARRQQESAILDANIQKEIGKVRSIDTPEVIKAYQDYKAYTQKALFDKKLQKDPQAYNDLLQLKNQAYQNIFTIANGSAEMKDFQKQQATGYAKNPNAYDDNAGTMLSEAMNTPYSQLRNHSVFGDLTNPNTYTYKGSNTNWAEHVQKAMGQPKQVYSKEDMMDGGLQTKITPYMYGNSPAQVKDYLIGTMATHQAGRDAAYQWDHTPEKEIEDTVKAYQALPKEYWERIGASGPQDILPKNPDNKAENYASLLAMKSAIANAPKEGTPVFRDNKKAIMDLNWARDKVMEGIKFGHAKKLKEGEQKAVDNWIAGYWDKRISDAKAGPPFAYQDANTIDEKGIIEGTKGAVVGTKVAHQIQLDGVAAKALARNGVEPSELYVMQDGNLLPIFYEYQQNYENGKKTDVTIKRDAKGNPVQDKEYSKPITMDQAYLAMGYRGQTKKELGGTMSSTYAEKNEAKSKHPLPAGQPKVVKQGGYTYTWNENTGEYE